MQSKYEQLRAVINQLLPERLELGFGCEVLFPHDRILTCLFGVNCFYRFIGHTGQEFIKTKEVIEFDNGISILGQTLTIADVLRAIQKNDSNLDHYKIEFETHSELQENFAELKVYKRGDDDIHIVKIDLSKPVSEWPDETLEKIINLIE